MNYNDFYKIAEYGNVQWKGYFTAREIAKIAYDYKTEFDESVKQSKPTHTISELLNRLKEDGGKECIDWYNQILVGIGIIELSAGSPYGDPIAIIRKKGDCYIIEAFDIETPTITFNYIAEEAVREILAHRDNPQECFDGCGAEEAYRNGSTTGIKFICGSEEIAAAIANDEEVRAFVEEILDTNEYLKSKLAEDIITNGDIVKALLREEKHPGRQVKSVSLDKVKQAREEIASSLNGLDEWNYADKAAKFYIERDLRILDKLIAEEE